MKKCPYCSAQMNDDSLFCTECGKPIPQGNVCPHCGASVNDGDTFCQNCGKKIDGIQPSSPVESTLERCPHCNTPYNDGSVFCENCGKKIIDEPSNASIQQQPQPSTRNGNLVIRWDGAWVLIDYKIKMNVNGNNIGEYSFKEGFETSVPITSSDMTVVTKLSFYKTKVNLTLNPNENYTYELVYHRMSGWLGFILYDSQGNELRRDKLHWGMFLLSFLLPIVGIIYAICVWKKKPATAHSAIYASILGFIVSFIVSFNLPTLSKFAEVHNSPAIVATDTIAEVVDSIDIDEEISDVHSKAFIKKRMEEICKAIYSIDEEKVVEKYFSSDFRKLYNTITTLEKSGKGGDGLWYSGGFFDGSSEGVDSMSVGQIHSIDKDYATVDFISHNGTYKNPLQAILVLEDGNWYVDNICNRMSDMSEYIDSMMDNNDDDEIKSQEELARTNTAIGAFDVKGDDSDSIR